MRETGLPTLPHKAPLVARDYLRVRLSYDIIENGNAYGDDVTTISGIYCPFMGESSLIHTRTTQYKIVPKRAAEDTPGFDFDVSGGSAALGVLSITVRGIPWQMLTLLNMPAKKWARRSILGLFHAKKRKAGAAAK
jgi:hypothetical protein